MRGPACLSVHVCAYSWYVRDREVQQRRLPYSGLENVISRAGVVRTLLSLSFAVCKMGITDAAFTQRLLWNTNELVDLNSKELLDLSSMSGCVHDCVGAHSSVRLCHELPVTLLSCRDKPAVSSVPILQKHTCFWPRARLSNSPGGSGEWRRRSARWPSCLSQSDPHRARGHRPSLRVGAQIGLLRHEIMYPLSYWGLPGGRNHSSTSPFLPQKSREVVTQCDCDSFCLRGLWGHIPEQGFRVQGVLAARCLLYRV